MFYLVFLFSIFIYAPSTWVMPIFFDSNLAFCEYYEIDPCKFCSLKPEQCSFISGIQDSYIVYKDSGAVLKKSEGANIKDSRTVSIDKGLYFKICRFFLYEVSTKEELIEHEKRIFVGNIYKFIKNQKKQKVEDLLKMKFPCDEFKLIPAVKPNGLPMNLQIIDKSFFPLQSTCLSFEEMKIQYSWVMPVFFDEKLKIYKPEILNFYNFGAIIGLTPEESYFNCGTQDSYIVYKDSGAVLKKNEFLHIKNSRIFESEKGKKCRFFLYEVSAKEVLYKVSFMNYVYEILNGKSIDEIESKLNEISIEKKIKIELIPAVKPLLPLSYLLPPSSSFTESGLTWVMPIPFENEDITGALYFACFRKPDTYLISKFINLKLEDCCFSEELVKLKRYYIIYKDNLVFTEEVELNFVADNCRIFKFDKGKTYKFLLYEVSTKNQLSVEEKFNLINCVCDCFNTKKMYFLGDNLQTIENGAINKNNELKFKLVPTFHANSDIKSISTL